MKSKIFLFNLIALCSVFQQGSSHCQMPCGIYHDDMVFDQIDQYVETMYKGISVINDSKFSTTKDRNETIRWVIQKEKASDEAAELITAYFLQQKIKPGEPDTVKRLTSAHLLLFQIVAIKQNVDLAMVKEFATEWDKFKLMFHREGYECAMEKIKLKEIEEKKSKVESNSDHSHDHSDGHPHDHTH